MEPNEITITEIVENFMRVSEMSEIDSYYAVIGFGLLDLQALVQYFCALNIDPQELRFSGTVETIAEVCRCSELVAHFRLMGLGYGNLCRLVDRFYC